MCECIEERDIVGFLAAHGVGGSFFDNHRGNDAKVILEEFTQLLMSFETCEEDVVEEGAVAGQEGAGDVEGQSVPELTLLGLLVEREVLEL